MSNIVSFNEAFERRKQKQAEEAEFDMLTQTFPYILVESCICIGRTPDWETMTRVYEWDAELVQKLHVYADRLIANIADTSTSEQ